MKKFSKLIGLIIISLISLNSKASKIEHIFANLVSPPPKINAKSYILFELNSNTTLVSYNANDKLPPASLTKIMTDFIVAEFLKSNKISLTDEVIVSRKAWQMKGSRTFLKLGSKVSVEDLIKGLIIQSGNDSAIALAEYIAGSEDNFVILMNKVANQLGMRNTKFKNTSGLPTYDHYTTAKDLIILTKELIKRFPDQYKYYSEKSFTFNKIKQNNRNRLLWMDDRVTGMKTGFTSEAGYNIIAVATQNDMTLIAIIFGAKSENARAIDTKKLLDYGFRFFNTIKIFDAYIPIHQAKVWKSNIDKFGVGIHFDYYLTIPRGYNESITEINLIYDDKYITAPLRKGDILGKVDIVVDNDNTFELPLVSTQNVSSGNFFKRIVDELKIIAHKFFQ